MNYSPGVRFDYSNRQGLFRVSYPTEGAANVCAYMTSDEPDPSCPPVIDFFSWRQSWCHDDPVALDLERLSETELIEKYRAIFLSRDIGRTYLETPEESRYPLVEIRVFARDDVPIRICFRGDGQGWISSPVTVTDEDDLSGPYLSHPFKHDVPAADLAQDAAILDAGSWAADAVTGRYEALFWDDINDQFHDRVIRSMSEIQGNELTIRNCTEDEFRTLMTAACRLDDDLWNSGSWIRTFGVRSALSDKDTLRAEISCCDNDEFSQSTICLVEALLNWARPTGYEMRSNYSSRIATTGYEKYAIVISERIGPPSATERMEAMTLLCNWMAVSGVDISHLLPA